MQYKIYKATSPSGKCYIGLTSKTVEWRWNNHKSTWMTQLRKHKKYNCPKLFKAFEKYNPFVPGNWFVEEIATGTGKAEAMKLEEYHIATFNSLNGGYNAHPGGKYSNGLKGKKQSPEHIAKRFTGRAPVSDHGRRNQQVARLKMFDSPEGILLKEKLAEYGRNGKGRKHGPCPHHVKEAVSAATSLYFRIRFPDGTTQVASGLGKFCKENLLTSHLLSETRPGGKRTSHKGFKIIEVISQPQ